MPIDHPQAFAAFYRDTVVDLTAFVRRRTHPVQVEDVIAQTYAIAWRRRGDIPSRGPGRADPTAPQNSSHDPARAWLFGVARNQVMATTRGQQQRAALAVRLATEANLATPDPTIGVSERDGFRAAWAMLTAADQEVLALQLLDGLDTSAAAQVLGCSKAALSMRLSRARRHLRRALAAVRSSDDGVTALIDPPPGTPAPQRPTPSQTSGDGRTHQTFAHSLAEGPS